MKFLAPLLASLLPFSAQAAGLVRMSDGAPANALPEVEIRAVPVAPTLPEAPVDVPAKSNPVSATRLVRMSDGAPADALPVVVQVKTPRSTSNMAEVVVAPGPQAPRKPVQLVRMMDNYVEPMMVAEPVVVPARTAQTGISSVPVVQAAVPAAPLSASAAMAAGRQMLTQSNVGEDNEVLLELQVNGRAAPELLRAYRSDTDDAVYIPLSILVAQLGLPIRVAAQDGVAEGWLVSEKRTFKLDLRDGSITLSGKRQVLPPGAAYTTADDIYVHSGHVQAWMPLEAKLSWDDLSLAFTTTEVLPSEARLARRTEWDRLSGRGGVLPTGPKHELERPFFGWPALKLDYSTVAGKNAGGTAQSQGLSLQAEGNLAGMDSFLSLQFQQGNSNREGLTGGSFRLARDYVSGTSGLLGLTHLELGDVSLPRQQLLVADARGQGVSFHNKPNGFAGSLNQFELEGDAPAGWDVEVYQDEALLAFGVVENNGRYRFSQLNLRPGANDFRIVLYGPQGQQQEQRQSFYLGEGMIGQGEWVYEAGLTTSPDPLISPNRSSDRAGTMALNAFYGLNRHLSLNLGAVSGPIGTTKEENSGVSAGLRAAFGKSFSQLNMAAMADGGTALALRERYQFGKDTDIGAFYTRQASSTLASQQPHTLKGLEFSDTIQPGFPLRYGLTLTEESFPHKQAERQLNATQSWRAGGVSFNHSIGRRFLPTGGKWDGGDLSFATYMKGMPLRGQALYQLEGDEPLTSIMLGTQVRLREADTLNLQGQYQPGADLTTLNANLQRDLGPLVLGLQSSWQSNNDYQIGLNLGLQLVPQTRSGNSAPRWKAVPARSQGLGYGSAEVVVFVDDNGNGRHEETEEVLEGVEVRNARSGKVVSTDQTGVAHLGDLLPNTETLVQLVEESLPDIYLRPVSVWHVFLAHRGHGGQVYLPVVRLGEIAGMMEGANNTELTLLGADGKQVERTLVQPDGSFFFQTVPLGTYTLQALRPGGVPLEQQVVLTREKPEATSLSLKM